MLPAQGGARCAAQASTSGVFTMIACTRCGASNQPTSKFCLSCGNPLAAAAPSPAYGAPPPAPAAQPAAPAPVPAPAWGPPQPAPQPSQQYAPPPQQQWQP